MAIDQRSPVGEDELVLGVAPKRPVMCPRPGEDVLAYGVTTAVRLLGPGARRGRILKIRRVVGFTREWTSLALVSFDVDTDDGPRKISALPDPDGLWLEIRP